MTLPRSKRCVFSTANDNYVPKAIVSLLSFHKHNADFDMFLLCGALSDENRQLCASCRVTPIELNRSDAFYQEWDYPRECYYHFEGPGIFLSRGYEYSVYIDGDTYCNRPFCWDENECKSFQISGSSYDTVRDFLVAVGDYEAICERFAVTNIAGFNRDRIQAGVLLYDNRVLEQTDYFAKARDLYDRCIKASLPRKGDDSLLALLLALHAVALP
jgi:lipopolysaccharide biosynthesis glycosyltransferase